MRYSASEKYEIIQLVEQSSLSVKHTLARLDIHKFTFYNWLKRFYDYGVAGLEDKKPSPNIVWNKISDKHYSDMLQLAFDKPALSPCELAVNNTDEKSYFVSESSVYRLLKEHDSITSPAYILMQASDKFQSPTTRDNEIWQTDLSYFKIIGWGWYYLSTILDDTSRYNIVWRLCTSMGASDVKDTLDDVLNFTVLDHVKVKHKPHLFSDNGPCYISGELAEYLNDNNMTHTRGRPYHPQTQGNIERWHRSMKNQILLNHYAVPCELEMHIEEFVNYYNHGRYHESLDNLTPADVFYGRGQEILEQRAIIKSNTMATRRKVHYDRQMSL